MVYDYIQNIYNKVANQLKGVKKVRSMFYMVLKIFIFATLLLSSNI